MFLYILHVVLHLWSTLLSAYPYPVGGPHNRTDPTQNLTKAPYLIVFSLTSAVMVFNPDTWICLYSHLGTVAATTESADYQQFRYRCNKEVSEG